MTINRLSGLVSGMDTDTLVKQLMDAERIPVNKMKQERQKLQWKSDSYRQWNTDLFTFRTNTLFNMKLSKSYGTYNVTGDTNKVTSVATAEAIAGTNTLKIDSLAQAATFKGTTKVDPTKALNAQEAGYRKLDSDATITVSVTDASGKTRTANLTVSASDNINAVVNSLNTAKQGTESLGLQAYYDSNLQQMIVKTKDTGANSQIKIMATTDSDPTKDAANRRLFYVLGFTTANPPSQHTFTTGTPAGADETNGDAGVITKGANADITFNNTRLTNLTSNTANLLGVNYTFKETTGGSTLTLTVSRDLDAEIKNIKDFITGYNDLLDKLNNAVSEPVYKDYQPLTDEQREALSEKQIEQWEQKSKSGLLRRDSALSLLISNMRNHATSTVDNGSKYNSLSSIGIKSTSYKDQGKLTIDEDQLRKALEEDPESVKSLFVQDPANATDGKKGIIVRLYDDFASAIKTLTEKAGAKGNVQDDDSTVGKLIDDFNSRIDNAENRLIDKENNYYRKFTAMEKALSQYNSQSAWLTQQFSAQ